jgi:hypothetical protein
MKGTPAPAALGCALHSVNHRAPGAVEFRKESAEFLRPKEKEVKTMKATWEPYEEHNHLTTRSNLPDSVFAFPKQRKEPLTDERHVRNAVARFDQVLDVSDEDRALAFANIEKAAKHYHVDLSETNWRQLGVHPNPHRFEAAAKAATRKVRARRRA